MHAHTINELERLWSFLDGAFWATQDENTEDVLNKACNKLAEILVEARIDRAHFASQTDSGLCAPSKLK